MLPKASQIDKASQEIATRFWKDKNFNRGIAIHKYLDGWGLVEDERRVIKKILRNDVLHYLKTAPASLDLTPEKKGFIIRLNNAFDGFLEWLVT